jgi:Flp pilus assembly secretin CpaC
MPPRKPTRARRWKLAGTVAMRCAAGLALVMAAVALLAQTAQTPAAGQSSANAANQNAAPPAGPSKPSGKTASTAAPGKDAASQTAHLSGREKRRAAKLYLAASKLFLDRRFEQAMKGFERAAALDPTNADYRLAARVARSHTVTALIQEAAKDRLKGNDAASRAALERARALDPGNAEIGLHLDELAGDNLRSQPQPLYEQSQAPAGPIEPEPTPGLHSFHLHEDERQLIPQVLKAYGLTAMLDAGVRPLLMRFDVDDVNFEQAAQVLSLATNTFFVPLDAHHALVAEDTSANRRRLQRQDAETVYLNGLSDDELNEVLTVAKSIFMVSQATLSLSDRAIVLRAPESSLNAFNATMQNLLDGRSQVMVDVRLIQLAHTSTRNTGAQLPQTMSAFNVYAEEQSILNANASLVQQIISSGLASPNDPLAILGILIASGQVSSNLLSSGFALFGGGIAQSALVPGPATLNLSLNSSDSRELDQVLLRLQDGEKGTLKLGESYPIQTSVYSNPMAGSSALAGLNIPGTSSNLSSLFSSLSSASLTIPMVQYQDIGLTLSITPRALRNDDVALTIEMKLDALAGTYADGNPILNNREYDGVITLKEGEATVVAAELDKSQSEAISGTPGLSEIPGLNNANSVNLQKNYATLVIVMTPHVVRGPQAAGHTAMMRVEKGGTP